MGKDYYMKEIDTKTKQNSCRIHMMPSAISDDDISALFNGLLGIVKRKAELDSREEVLSLNISRDRLMKLVDEKQAEINRLKNEIIYLKSELGKKSDNQ